MTEQDRILDHVDRLIAQAERDALRRRRLEEHIERLYGAQSRMSNSLLELIAAVLKVSRSPRLRELAQQAQHVLTATSQEVTSDR